MKEGTISHQYWALSWRKGLGLIYDLCLGSIIYFFLLSMSKWDQWGDFEVLHILGIWVVSHLVRCWTVLGPGVSIGNYLWGLRANTIHSFIWYRIGAMAREMLSMFIFPSFPSKGSSIKENWTRSYLKKSSFFLSIVPAVILAPVFLYFLAIAPITKDLVLFDGATANFDEVKEVYNDLDPANGPYQKLKSNRFRFISGVNSKQSNFVFFPGFEFKKKNNKTFIAPYISIYDRQNKVWGKMSYAKKDIKLLKLVHRLKASNPLFERYYPNTYNVLKNKKTLFTRVPFKQKGNNPPLVNKKVLKEIRSILNDSFDLSFDPYRVIHHISEKGPFLSGYARIREGIMGRFRKGVGPNVDFARIGDHVFLRFFQKFNTPLSNGMSLFESLLPVETNNSDLIELAWQNKNRASDTRRRFNQEILGAAKWYFDYRNISEFPSKFKNLNMLHIVDFYTKDSLKPKQRRMLEGHVKGKLYWNSRNALMRSDRVLLNELPQVVSALETVAKYRNQITPGYFSNAYIKELAILKNAIKNENSVYFKL